MLLALLFLLLAAFPGQLFNKTLEENYEEVVGWFSRGGRWAERARDALQRFWKRRSGVISFVVLSGLLYGFLDPAFGPTLESFALLGGILVGLAVIIATFELPVAFLQRQTNRDRGRIRVQPLTIGVAVVCVLLSRIADFQPGYLYGLVAGFAFLKPMSRRDEGRAAALTAFWMLVVALVAWLLLPSIEAAAAGSPLLSLAVGAALATIFVGGLEGLLFELVPLRFLRGEKLFAWRRPLWAALFVIAAFLVAHILLTSSSGYLGDTRTSPLISAVVLFVGFGIVSVAFWGYFRFRPNRPEPTARGPA
jgi:hypothetical protein